MMEEALADISLPKASKKKKGRKPKKALLSAAQKALNKLKADHRSAVRACFTRAGFNRVSGVSDREFIYDNQKGDFDDVFVYENVVILTE